MLSIARVIMAPHGSTLTGSLRIASTVSVHRIARVVLHIAVNIDDLSLLMLLVDGSVHCVP